MGLRNLEKMITGICIETNENSFEIMIMTTRIQQFYEGGLSSMGMYRIVKIGRQIRLVGRTP